MVPPIPENDRQAIAHVCQQLGHSVQPDEVPQILQGAVDKLRAFMVAQGHDQVEFMTDDEILAMLRRVVLADVIGQVGEN